MGIKVDRDVETVLEFMERNVEADKLTRVAETVALLAPVLWFEFDILEKNSLVSFRPESNRGQQSTAIQLPPVRACACDGSEEVKDTP